MVGVFREVWRILRDDGTVWLNLGDSFAHNGACGGGSPVDVRKSEYGRKGYASDHFGGRDEAKSAQIKATVPAGLKAKDLVGMPWRVVFALQADGWYLRSDIIWAKPNPMPESVTDRPTRSHEYLFLLSKRERYFYDADAIKERGSETSLARINQPSFDSQNGGAKDYGAGSNRSARRMLVNLKDKQRGHSRRHDGFNDRWDSMSHEEQCSMMVNKRDVWNIPSEPNPEAHFATFPQKLVEPCILAGTSEKGCCVECGAPRVRELGEASGGAIGKAWLDHSNDAERGNFKTASSKGYQPAPTLGWRPSCAHDAPSVPCIVFDPFLGSGTVGKVCERLGRRWGGLELSEQYIGIAKQRTAQMGFGFGGLRSGER